MKETPSALISRRGFLRSIGLLSGSLATGAAPLALGGNGPAIRAGVLLPRSDANPGLGNRLLAGLRLGIREAARDNPGARVDLVSDTVSGPPSTLAAAAARMLERDAPAVLVALVNGVSLAGLIPALETARIPLLGLTAGVDAPGELATHPLVFANSLELWRSAWALGQWSAGRLGPRAMVASSFYESGFDHLEAFRLGFESAGGQILACQVTDIPGRPDRLGDFLKETALRQPDFVAAFHSGEQAVHFALRWRQSGLAGQVPLAGPAFLVDERMPDHGTASLDGAWSVLPWSPALDSPENRSFVKRYLEFDRCPPDAFALLGFEAGSALVEACRLAGQAWPGRASLGETLRAVALRSPRGDWRLDAAGRPFTSPLYLRRLDPDRQNTVVQELPSSALTPEHLAALRPDGRTGWIDSYLCG